MQSENGRRAAVAAWGAPVPGPSTGTFLVQPYMTTATIPQKRKPEPQDQNSDSIDCICGFTYDDGSLSIACDECERWCHAACFDIVEGEVPEEWRCWECLPRPVFKERAVRIQKDRQRQIQGMMGRNSPGVEKKPRRASAAAIEGSKRKRRPSILTQTHTHTQTQRAEDEHVEICEPWTLSYVPIAQDIVPHRQTREKLERAAHSWRGVTALQVSEQDLHLSRTTIQPLPTSSFSHPTLSLCTNPSVRPPSYAVHAAEPIPRSRMITPYHSTIIPSAVYLSDTLNAYAHLGMPKPFVHLVGPPLDVALDSRITGDSSRFVRSGCKPNAVLRPMICSTSKNKGRDYEGALEHARDTIAFGVFALRDLKANEEIILGWEWDDGHAAHNLPALIESPHSFKPHHVEHLRNQMTSMLNSLSSTFTTCACGAKANDCALNLMAAFVDGELLQKPDSEHIDLGPLVGSARGFKTREKIPFSGGMTGVEMVSDHFGARINQVPNMNGDVPNQVNGRQGSPERRAFSAPELSPNPTGASSASRTTGGKGKERATAAEDYDNANGSVTPPDGSRKRRHGQSRRRRVTTDSVPASFWLDIMEEDKMPPKMRKRWIHQSSEALRNAQSREMARDEGVTDDEAVEVDPDSTRMPPPPLPLYRQPTNGSTTPSSALSSVSPSSSDTDRFVSPPSQDISPSSYFANLSLLSPIVDHPKSFPPKELSPFNFPNQSTPRLPRSFSPGSKDTTPIPTSRSTPSLETTKSPAAPKRSGSVSPPTEVVKPPSPLRLLSPIDGNVAHPESDPLVQRISLDSPQMLLLLPQFKRHKRDEVNEGITDPSLLPQLPQTLQSPQRAQSPPTISYPPPDPPPRAESTSRQQLSPTPQKVKTSFKDFLMRKKRQQEEYGDMTASPNTTSLEADSSRIGMVNGDDEIGSDVGDYIGRVNEGGEEHRSPSPGPPNSGSDSSQSANAPLTGDSHDTCEVEYNVSRDSRPIFLEDPSDYGNIPELSESWILDSKFSPIGLVVQVRDEWHKRDMAGIQGIVKAVVHREGMAPLAILKPLRSNSHDSVPIVYMIPVPPNRTGDIVTVIGGRLKGEMGSVIDIREGGLLVQLDSTKAFVEVREGWTCRSSKDGDIVQAEAFLPAQQPLLEEDGEIGQVSNPALLPSTSTTSVRQLYAPPGTPTQPRSFLTHPSSSKPVPRPPPLPLPPSRPRQASPSSQSAIGRPPSGPKAFRVGGPKSAYSQSHSPYPPKRGFGTNPNGSLGLAPLPKGPSADRDREREWTGSNWSSSRNRAPPGGWR